jgi:hypothetical protein
VIWKRISDRSLGQWPGEIREESQVLVDKLPTNQVPHLANQGLPSKYLCRQCLKHFKVNLAHRPQPATLPALVTMLQSSC